LVILTSYSKYLFQCSVSARGLVATSAIVRSTLVDICVSTERC